MAYFNFLVIFNFSTKVAVRLTFLYRADFFDTYYGRKGCRNITALVKVKNNQCGRFFLEISCSNIAAPPKDE